MTDRRKAYKEQEKGLSLAVPAHTVRLVSLREERPHPQFVGDDRHLTQGAVELQDERWDASRKELTLDVTAIGGFPFVYSVRVPEGFACKAVKASEGAKAEMRREGDLLRVMVSANKTTTVKITLQF